MLTDPKISACIVLYHSGDQALQAVRCFQDATVPVSLFVVDNSPDEPTASRVKLQDPDAQIIPMKKNIGYGRGNNAVLNLLKSRYHLICNPDVTFDPDLPERMAAYMDAHDDIVILSPRAFNPDGSEQFLPRRRPSVRYLLGGRRALRGDRVMAKAKATAARAAAAEEEAVAAWKANKEGGGLGSLLHANRLELRQTLLSRRAARLQARANHLRHWRDEYTLADTLPTAPTEVQFATGCFLMIRTHIFYRMKGFDPRYFLYHEDSDLSLGALKYGKVVYHPDMHITHAWRRASSRSLKAALTHALSTVKFFHKWGWKW